MENETAFSFEYVGDSPTWPVYLRETGTGSEAETRSGNSMCATLHRPCSIGPGEAVRFPAHSTRTRELRPDGSPGERSRVGLRLTNTTTGEVVTVWTPRFLPVVSEEDLAFEATLHRSPDD